MLKLNESFTHYLTRYERKSDTFKKEMLEISKKKYKETKEVKYLNRIEALETLLELN